MLKKISVPKSIILLIILAIMLNLFRIIFFDKLSLVYILWNIFLAYIPFFISSVLLYLEEQKKLKNYFLIIGGIIWLIFLPNAPYIITDLIHIGVIRSVPIVFDSVLIFTSAWIGLLFALYSISHIEKILLLRFSKKVSYVIIILVLLFTSFGIYIGRFLRFNSWEIFTNPLIFLKELLEALSQSTHNIEALLYTILFFVFMCISYLSWKLSKTS